MNNDDKSQKQDQIKPQMEIDFGSRRLNTQNFSKTVVLPKEALSNCGCNLDDVGIMLDVKLVQKDGQRYIKLTPVRNTSQEEKEIVDV